MDVNNFFILFCGFLLGALSMALWFWRTYYKKISVVSDSLALELKQKSMLEVELAKCNEELNQSKNYFHKRIEDLQNTHAAMKESFASLSKETLIKNVDLMNSSFKQSLDQLMKTNLLEKKASEDQLKGMLDPLKNSLLKMDEKVSLLEANRQGAYSGLKEQIESLIKSQNLLQKETGTLAKALHAPGVRGKWGEMQLRRVVELSGLSQHCDFLEQFHIKGEDESLRPDMVVTLPKNKKIVIDAKAPLDLLMADGPKAQTDLVANLKRHLNVLKKKEYSKIVGDCPEFTVMFLPGESILHQALTVDPGLLEFAAENNIIIATPITLVALLKAVAFGFKQEAIANNIEEVRNLSQQLIDRIKVVASHFEKLGRNLKGATDAYNQTLSSLESRVLVTARKLSEIKSLNKKDAELGISSQAFLEASPKTVGFGENCDGSEL